MRRWMAAAAVIVSYGLGFGRPSLADESNDCRIGNQRYPPDVTLCSNGLVVTCQNGTWQNDDGRRCDEPTGTWVGPRRPFRHKNGEAIPQYVKEKYPELNLR